MTPSNTALTLAELTEEAYPWRSEHQAGIERHFGERLLRPLSDEERDRCARLRVFCLLFSNRSGSTLLADTLFRAGFPIPPQVEPFNADLVIATACEHGMDSFVDYLLALVQNWPEHGWLGFKIGPRQFAWLARLGLLELFREVRVLTCGREDKLRQAVSLYVARATNSWHSGMPAGTDPDALPYCRETLLACLREVLESERLIEYLCALHGPERFATRYEGLLDDAPAVVAAAGRFLAIDPQPRARVDPVARPPLRRQSSSVNDRLLAQLREELALGAG